MNTIGNNLPVRRRKLFDVGGSGRAAAHMQPTIEKLSKTSGTELVPTYVDPVDGKAEKMATQARSRGIDAAFEEGRIEDLLAPRTEHLPAVIHVDRPEAARDIWAARGAAAPLFVYVLVAAFGQPLRGYMAATATGDIEGASANQALFAKLASVTAASGSSQVFGDRAPSANHLAETKIREQFRQHFERNLMRALGGAALEDPPLLVTDGNEPQPVVVLPPDPNWRSPRQIEADALAAMRTPLRRGARFTVAELGNDDSLRMHEATLRRLDGGFAVGGTPMPSNRGVHAELPNTEARAVAALERSTVLREEWNRRNAIVTSD